MVVEAELVDFGMFSVDNILIDLIYKGNYRRIGDMFSVWFRFHGQLQEMKKQKSYAARLMDFVEEKRLLRCVFPNWHL